MTVPPCFGVYGKGNTLLQEHMAEKICSPPVCRAKEEETGVCSPLQELPPMSRYFPPSHISSISSTIQYWG